MYVVKFTDREPGLEGLWEGPDWRQIRALEVSHFRPEGSSHRPKTLAKLLYTRRGIAGIFHVEDNYVRCVHQCYLDPVYKDSCVGIALRPGVENEHFSFEFSCGGTLRACFVTASDDANDGLKVFMPLSRRDAAGVRVYHSLPPIVEPETSEPVVWLIEFFIPFSIVEKFLCRPVTVKGSEWRANLYKCGDSTSHPHWASWAPLRSNKIHALDSFGKIRFE